MLCVRRLRYVVKKGLKIFAYGRRQAALCFEKNMRKMRAVEKTAILRNFRNRTSGIFQKVNGFSDTRFRQILLWRAITHFFKLAQVRGTGHMR